MPDLTGNAPSNLAILISTSLLVGITGYLLGVFSALGFLPIPFLPSNGPNYHPSHHSESEPESDAEDIDEDVLDHAPNWGNGLADDLKDGLRARNVQKGERKSEKKAVEKAVMGKAAQVGMNEECKLVLVVRTDLGMTKGKIAAQASHATLACYKTSSRLSTTSPTIQHNLRQWEKQGQAKIAVQTKGEEELFLLQAKARSMGLVAEIIADAGRTQIAGGSYTVLGIGPGPKGAVDEITGDLRLL